MNDWFNDPRVRQAEADMFEAGHLFKRTAVVGNIEKARALCRQSAVAYAAVAERVAADHPNTRSDLALAAMNCHMRAGDFALGAIYARGVLARPDLLTAPGRAELAACAEECEQRMRRVANEIELIETQMRSRP